MITLTEKAAKQVQSVMEQEKMSEDTFLRVSVTGGGCSGFSYSLNFDTETTDMDKTVQAHGLKVVVDRKSDLYLDGMEIDFKEGLGGGFVFNNPNATKSCGCGSSFQV